MPPLSVFRRQAEVVFPAGRGTETLLYSVDFTTLAAQDLRIQTPPSTVQAAQTTTTKTIDGRQWSLTSAAAGLPSQAFALVPGTGLRSSGQGFFGNVGWLLTKPITDFWPSFVSGTHAIFAEMQVATLASGTGAADWIEIGFSSADYADQADTYTRWRCPVSVGGFRASCGRNGSLATPRAGARATRGNNSVQALGVTNSTHDVFRTYLWEPYRCEFFSGTFGSDWPVLSAMSARGGALVLRTDGAVASDTSAIAPSRWNVGICHGTDGSNGPLNDIAVKKFRLVGVTL